MHHNQSDHNDQHKTNQMETWDKMDDRHSQVESLFTTSCQENEWIIFSQTGAHKVPGAHTGQNKYLA